MRRTFAFLACAGLLAAVLAAAGCKSRDIRKLVAPYAPSPASTAPATLTIGDSQMEDEADGTTSGSSLVVCGEQGYPGITFYLDVQEYGYIWVEAVTEHPDQFAEFLLELKDPQGSNIECIEGTDDDIMNGYYYVYGGDGCFEVPPGVYSITVITSIGAEVTVSAGYCLG